MEKFISTQAGTDLGVVNAAQVFDRLHLDDDCAFDDKIQPMSSDRLAVIGNADIDFGSHRDSTLSELNGECTLIDSFEGTWAKLAMHLDDRINDCVSQIVRIRENVIP